MTGPLNAFKQIVVNNKNATVDNLAGADFNKFSKRTR